MIHAQKEKSVVFMAPVSVATNATESGTGVDCLGWDYAAIDIIMDTQSAVSDNPATMDLVESADATTYSAIAAFTADATNGFTVPNANTSVPNIVRFNVDLRKRERYLAVKLTSAGAAHLCSVLGRLSRRHQAYTPTGETDAELGCAEIVTG